MSDLQQLESQYLYAALNWLQKNESPWNQLSSSFRVREVAIQQDVFIAALAGGETTLTVDIEDAIPVFNNFEYARWFSGQGEPDADAGLGGRYIYIDNATGTMRRRTENSRTWGPARQDLDRSYREAPKLVTDRNVNIETDFDIDIGGFVLSVYPRSWPNHESIWNIRIWRKTAADTYRLEEYLRDGDLYLSNLPPSENFIPRRYGTYFDYATGFVYGVRRSVPDLYDEATWGMVPWPSHVTNYPKPTFADIRRAYLASRIETVANRRIDNLRYASTKRIREIYLKESKTGRSSGEIEILWRLHQLERPDMDLQDRTGIPIAEQHQQRIQLMRRYHQIKHYLFNTTNFDALVLFDLDADQHWQNLDSDFARPDGEPVGFTEDGKYWA